MKITTKTFKATERRNFIIDSYFYNEEELENFLYTYEYVFKFDESDKEYRLSLREMNRMEVKLVEGYFTNVAIMKDGNEFKITL